MKSQKVARALLERRRSTRSAFFSITFSKPLSASSQYSHKLSDQWSIILSLNLRYEASNMAIIIILGNSVNGDQVEKVIEWAHLMYVHHQEGLGKGPSLPDIPCLNCLHLFTALFYNRGTIIYLRLVCCVKTSDNLGYYDVWFRWLCLYTYHIWRDQEPQISAWGNDSCGELESEAFGRIEQNKISNFKSHLPEGKWEPLFKADAITVLWGGQRTKAEVYGVNNMLGRLNCKRERVKVVLFFYPQWFVNHLLFLKRSF